MIKINVIKASVPGFTKTFDSVEATAQELDKNICSGCKVTREELRETYDIEKMSEEARYEFEVDLDEAFPSDWKRCGPWVRINLLMGTPCGCEFDIEVYDD